MSLFTFVPKRHNNAVSEQFPEKAAEGSDHQEQSRKRSKAQSVTRSHQMDGAPERTGNREDHHSEGEDEFRAWSEMATHRSLW